MTNLIAINVVTHFCKIGYSISLEKHKITMSNKGKKLVGVWIDHKHAYIIGTPDRSNHGEYDVVKKLSAQHHSDHSSSENAHHNKVAQEIHKLYEDVTHQLTGDDSIFITGPGTAQEELKNFLKQNQHFHNKEIQLGTSDHPTGNQMIAEIRNHFKSFG